MLILDIDDTLSKDFCDNWISWHNRVTGDTLTKDKLTDWNISQFVRPDLQDTIYKHLENPQSANIIFKTCTPMEDSIEVTKWLQEIFDLQIVSSSHPINVPYKFQWLQRYYPHIPVRNINFWHDKTALTSVADWIIDDRFETVSRYKHGLLINREWNRKFQYNKRFNTFVEIKNYIQRLINLGIINKEGVA